jgi:hypothetical protein
MARLARALLLTHLGSGVCIAAVETMLNFAAGKEPLWSTQLVAKMSGALLTGP